MLSAATRPGMKFQRVSRLGLNQARCSMRSAGGRPPWRSLHWALKPLTTSLT